MIFAGGQRIAMKQVTSGSISYFHADHLDSTNVLTDGNGTSEEDLVYYPYGETFTNTGTADVAYKYTGKERDGSTGLYFYEARYYDAALGRFISADTIVPSATAPQTLNRYTYANNNPILYTDPSGHFGIKSIKKGAKKFFRANKRFTKSVESFAFENRVYLTLGHSIGADWLLTNRHIGPYVHMVGTAVAAYYGGPWAAAGAQAYYTRLNGGSFEDAAKAGGISLATAYAGQTVTALGGNYILAGAGAGATRAALSGDDVGRGALMGAGSAIVLGALQGRNVPRDILDAAGKAWNLPNTAIGLAWGGIGVLGGAGVSIGNNAIQFTNHPLGVGAVTLGNTISYTPGSSPGDFDFLYGSKVLLNIGLHEQAHTYHSQVYGPLFLPLWVLGGGPSASNPFEQSANNFALGGSWWLDESRQYS